MSGLMTEWAAHLQWMRECGQPDAFERLQENLRRAEVEEPEYHRQAAARKQAEFDAAVDARVDARLRELGLLDANQAEGVTR
ncbi:hypothetical protein [Novosphingobium sp. ES2-1]|jgi:hypothetical protein|uniref:hypothetical protein n=1 Tax=Novosphingobium sp. ES2-1 TaxID=2780074 RepID=UPI00187ED79A|nr:hypothetical protein [Novosphingobium sp. ES2-1]QOV92622.1 hypothetical protein IM701_07880 [Novosphingobium sp. ES2-1]